MAHRKEQMSRKDDIHTIVFMKGFFLQLYAYKLLGKGYFNIELYNGERGAFLVEWQLERLNF